MAFLSCVLARPLSCWPPLALEAKLGHLSIRLALSEVLSEEVSAFLLQLFLGTWLHRWGLSQMTACGQAWEGPMIPLPMGSPGCLE